MFAKFRVAHVICLDCLRSLQIRLCTSVFFSITFKGFSFHLPHNTLAVSHPVNAWKLTSNFENNYVSYKSWRSIKDCFTFSTDMMRALVSVPVTPQKIKFSIRNFFRKCDQILSFLRIWSHLLKKSLIENFTFCAMSVNKQVTWNFTRCGNVYNKNISVRRMNDNIFSLIAYMRCFARSGTICAIYKTRETPMEECFF